MLTYTAPVSDYRFLFEEVLRLDASLVGLYQDLELDSELLHSILEEAGKFSRDVLQPLNAIGDTQGCRLADGVVTTAEGFADAYRAFVAAGWSSVSSPTAYGGQGLPRVLPSSIRDFCRLGRVSDQLRRVGRSCEMLGAKPSKGKLK